MFRTWWHGMVQQRSSAFPRGRRALALERLEDRTQPSFLAPVSYVAGDAPYSVAAGDFNGDGLADLVSANLLSSDVSILLGNGDGSFRPVQNYGAGVRPFALTVGDFNRDGRLDLAVANNTLSGGASVLLGNGDGSFQPAQGYATGPLPESLTTGDFNSDGHLDLAVANFGTSPFVVNSSLSVLLGNGDGTFGQAINTVAGGRPRSVAAADFNGDGRLDLVTADQVGTASIFLGAGDGTFPFATSFVVGLNPGAVAVGDFNGDGLPDFAMTNTEFVDVTSPCEEPECPVIRIISIASSVNVFLGNGDGTFQTPLVYDVGAGARSVAVGDFNGDGRQDLVTAGNFANTVSVLLGNGDGTFQHAIHYDAGPTPVSVAVGDFNGDGLPDLAVANSFADIISVLLNAAD